MFSLSFLQVFLDPADTDSVTCVGADSSHIHIMFKVRQGTGTGGGGHWSECGWSWNGSSAGRWEHSALCLYPHNGVQAYAGHSFITLCALSVLDC